MILRKRFKKRLAAAWLFLFLATNFVAPCLVSAQEEAIQSASEVVVPTTTPLPEVTPTIVPEAPISTSAAELNSVPSSNLIATLIPTPADVVAKGDFDNKGNKPKMAKINFRSDESVQLALGDYKDKQPSISIFRGGEQVENLETKIEDGNLKITPQRNFKPGKYTIKVQENETKDIVMEQNFTWGVLAINTNKSIFLSGEKAYLQMAALDDSGHTLCKSSLKLEIRSAKSETTILTTQDGTIKNSETCGADNVTDNPDYFAYYDISGIGSYKLKLTNLDNGYEIEDSFEVKENVPFEIERVGATRINPFKANYTMSFKIKANRDFVGEIQETIPSSFKILNNPNNSTMEQSDNGTMITWQVDWKSGDTYELSYEYDAPDISPQFYLLGPLTIKQLNNETIFSESRQWQIAADSAETDSIMVYDTQTIVSTPKYRRWTGSWGSEASANDVNGVIKHQVLKFSPTRDEAILATLTSTGELQAQVWNGSSWGSVTTLGALTTSGDLYSQYRYFDLEYESTSGDAIIVYSDGSADPDYKVWNGTGWSENGADINIPTIGIPYWIEMAADPGSDEMAMISIDSNNDVYGMYWSGSAWGDMGTSTTWDAGGSSGAYKTEQLFLQRLCLRCQAKMRQ